MSSSTPSPPSSSSSPATATATATVPATVPAPAPAPAPASSSSWPLSSSTFPCPYSIVGCSVLSTPTTLPLHLVTATQTHIELFQQRYLQIMTTMKHQRAAMINAQTRCRETSLENERLRQQLAQYQHILDEKQDASWITFFPHSPSPSASLVHVSRTSTPHAPTQSISQSTSENSSPQHAAQPHPQPHPRSYSRMGVSLPLPLEHDHDDDHDHSHPMSMSVPLPNNHDDSQVIVPIPTSASTALSLYSITQSDLEEEGHSFIHVEPPPHESHSPTSSMASLPTGSAPLTPVSHRLTPASMDTRSTTPASTTTSENTTTLSSPPTSTAAAAASASATASTHNDPLSLTSLLHLLDHLRSRILAALEHYLSSIPPIPSLSRDPMLESLWKQRQAKEIEARRNRRWTPIPVNVCSSSPPPCITSLSDDLSTLSTLISVVSSEYDLPIPTPTSKPVGTSTRTTIPTSTSTPTSTPTSPSLPPSGDAPNKHVISQVTCVNEPDIPLAKQIRLDLLCPVLWWKRARGCGSGSGSRPDSCQS